MHVKQGVCHALFAGDVGQRIDLAACRPLLAEPTEQATLAHKHHAPEWFQFDPPPLRVTQAARALAVGRFQTLPVVETVVYDFGAVCVTYGIPVSGGPEELVELSCALAADKDLEADARARLEQVLATIRPAVLQPRVDTLLEDYVVFQLPDVELSGPLRELPARRGHELARILRAEHGPLSDQEVADALAAAVTFGPDDLTLIDWNTALVFDREADDVRAVLEFANVQLLEIRFLDEQLDRALDRSYETLLAQQDRWRLRLASRGAELNRVARLQVDGAVLFERVSNALKLLGDQYLARVYNAASRRLRLAEWDAAIVHKLGTLESIYAKLSDRAAVNRMEVLEWIIIVLIFVSIVLPFLKLG